MLQRPLKETFPRWLQILILTSKILKHNFLNHFVLHYRSQFIVNNERWNDSKVMFWDFWSFSFRSHLADVSFKGLWSILGDSGQWPPEPLVIVFKNKELILDFNLSRLLQKLFELSVRWGASSVVYILPQFGRNGHQEDALPIFNKYSHTIWVIPLQICTYLNIQ